MTSDMVVRERRVLTGMAVFGAVAGAAAGYWVGGRERQMAERNHRLLAAAAGAVLGAVVARWGLPRVMQ